MAKALDKALKMLDDKIKIPYEISFGDGKIIKEVFGDINSAKQAAKEIKNKNNEKLVFVSKKGKLFYVL